MTINVILNKLYQNYAQVFAPQPMMTIQRTSIALVKKGYIQIPLDYVQFLMLSDGLSWNGVELFSIDPHERKDTVFFQPTLMGIQEELTLKKLYPKTLVVGIGPEELIVYFNETHAYHLLDRYTYETVVKLPRLSDVLYFYGLKEA